MKFVQNWQAYPKSERGYVVFDLNADPKEERPLVIEGAWNQLVDYATGEKIIGKH